MRRRSAALAGLTCAHRLGGAAGAASGCAPSLSPCRHRTRFGRCGSTRGVSASHARRCQERATALARTHEAGRSSAEASAPRARLLAPVDAVRRTTASAPQPLSPQHQRVAGPGCSLCMCVGEPAFIRKGRTSAAFSRREPLLRGLENSSEACPPFVRRRR
ncbi:hypothetical protein FA09DRAFT_246670 [Tilletiopsis washingtonensis]|uniref:Secreted protein n=1 Tax=Tilletiopsis washingtonensis TaxID=58919 RepID=A0A316ZBH3_9BASI|nr:hypothetical protein FA09DRAFT_246670 [Tilletiopsis washingtonensis]PWN98646.1 hypothetical protein FA09DRAFT_246670 [Tilletiopsis washingtonensis]